MKQPLVIGGATLNQIPFDWEHNIKNILEAIKQSKKQQVDILCLPELCLTGYGCEDLFLSDWLVAAAWKHLQLIIPACTTITLNIGLPIRWQGITYNGVCVISNQKILGISLKQNLANQGVHYEPRWFSAWPAGHTQEILLDGQLISVGDLIYEVNGIKLGFEICEDAWQQESRPGHKLYRQGVDLLFNPSASHFSLGKSKLRKNQVVVEGSSSFQCAYVYVNLLGNEAGRMIYDGDIIFAQNGTILKTNKRFSFQEVNLQTCQIYFDQPAQTQQEPITDDLKKNEELASAIALALFDYLRKSKAKGFVLSLSGGADSSFCAVLVAEMVRRSTQEIGLKKVSEILRLPAVKSEQEIVSLILTCAYQSSKNSSSTTFTAAQKLAQYIGATFYHWNIATEVASYEEKIEKVIGRKLTWEQDDVAKQNIQARTRSPIIWLLANIKQSILLTTSNRSEGSVGYATMDGDTSGSLAPIAGLDKPSVIQWLKWAELELGYSGLLEVNQLQPTAELRPAKNTQTDEKDLMPYSLLVEIEKWAIQERKSPREVFQIMSATQQHAQLKEYIKKFFRLWCLNQWKRERLAPSFHLDDLNIDPRSWCRFPILCSNFKEELDELDNP